MDLRSNYPYWLLRDGIIKTYPSLDRNITTDIVVMGAGITGALVAFKLREAGRETVVVDRRHVGMGSTAASTALLQYEIDVPLCELIEKVGEKNAERSYCLCIEAINELETITSRVNGKSDFLRKPSLQYCSHKKDLRQLKKELLCRKKAGISVEWLDASELKNLFGIEKAAAVLSKDGAEVNAYALTHELLQYSIRKGLQVYDHTEISNITYERNLVKLETLDGWTIKCRKLIIACGYESQRYIPKKVEQFNSTYTIASEPIRKDEFWFKNSLIWETARPYLYLRTTQDHRIIVGGKDDSFSNPDKRDAVLNSKARQLESAFKKLFPSIPFKTDFKWAGTFASTKDGLPYIGSIPDRPHTYFALGYGGNGITFSVIAANLIRDSVNGVRNPDQAVFSFNR
jgi:glycine/D-amino acid oxidase-like deaminating enzyme